MAVFIQLDIPRELRFTLRSAVFLETALNVESIDEAIIRMQKGSVKCILEFFISCLMYPKRKEDSLDADKLRELIDDFICSKGIGFATKKLNECLTESTFLKDGGEDSVEKKS